MSRQRRTFVTGITAMTLAYSTLALSAEYDVEVRAGLGVSDNIARSPALEIDETIATVGFSFGVTDSTRRLVLQLSSNIDYFDYLDDTFDAEWVGGLNGAATISLIEDRLEWEIRDNFGQQLVDPLSPSRPGNRENVNFLTTGPTLRMFSATRNPVRVDARYSRVDYEERPFDNERMSGGLSIGRDTSRDTTVSLNLSAERTEFNNDGLTPPIDRREAFVRFEKAGLRNTLAIDLGYNDVEYDGQEGDGVLASLQWTYEVSANGMFSLSGGSRYSDQGNIFRLYQDITNDLSETIDGTVTPTPFRNDFAAIGYLLDAARYTVDLSAAWSKEDYENQVGINRELIRVRGRFQRDISRAVYAGASLTWFSRDFVEFDRTDDTTVAGLDIGYRLSPGLSLTLDYQNSRRDSSAIGGDFTENRIFLRAIYVPVWSR